jgi:nucleoside-diphosphate-sugar epimerase
MVSTKMGAGVDSALTERKSLSIVVTGASLGAGPSVVSRLVKAGHRVGGIVTTTADGHLMRHLGAQPVYAHENRSSEIASLIRMMKADALVDLGNSEANQTLVNLAWNVEELAARAKALADAAKDGGAKLLVQVSYAFVYGNHGGHDDHGSHGHGHHDLIDETVKPETGGHPLLKAVVKAEKAALSSGVGAVVLRAGYGYGAYYSALKQASQTLKQARPLPSGEGVVNYLYAEDLAEAIRRTVEANPAGEIFNVSDGSPITSLKFLSMFASEQGMNPPGKLPGLVNFFSAGKPLGDLLALSAPVSIIKINTALGFKPVYTLATGFSDAFLTWRAAEVR